MKKKGMGSLPQKITTFKDSEAEFRTLVEAAPILVWMSDTRDLCTYFNKSWLKFTGTTLEDQIGNGWKKSIHPGDLEKCVTNFLDATSKRKKFKMEYRLRYKDGTYHWVQDTGVPRYSTTKEYLGYIGSCVDIDSIKKAQLLQKQNQTRLQTLVREQTKALREKNKALKSEVKERRTTEKLLEYQSGKVERQKNRLLAIFDNVEEQVLIADKDRRITLANKSCVKLTGLSFKELKGRVINDVFKCRDKNGVPYPKFDPLKKTFEHKNTTSYSEHLHEDFSGKRIWVGVSATPILGPDGEIRQIVEVIRDITLFKELEKAKSEFVSMASHELRTPLTVINGYLHLLLKGDLGSLDDPIGQKNYSLILDKVYKETRRLTKLAEELLNVSRIENGKIKLLPKQISLERLINDVFAELIGLAEQKNIKLKLDNKPNGHTRSGLVFADQDKLKQVLVNLIDNAIKYTDSKGTIKVTYFEKDGVVFTQIKDNGTGISPKVLPHIFEKFQQGNGYLKENKGTGLGLFIVKSLIELHHGQIWVKSKPKVGSTFTFSLPITEPKKTNLN